MWVLTDRLPFYGDHMTVQDFIDAVKCGGFIDYDGYGYWATNKLISNIIVNPSEVKHSTVLNEVFTHIVWFNR